MRFEAWHCVSGLENVKSGRLNGCTSCSLVWAGIYGLISEQVPPAGRDLVAHMELAAGLATLTNGEHHIGLRHTLPFSR